MSQAAPLSIPPMSGPGRSALSCLPVVGRWCEYLGQRRRRRRIAAAIRAQLSSRAADNRVWLGDSRQREAGSALAHALRRFGWPTEKIIVADPMAALMECEDDFKLVEMQFDLEDWLKKKVDPQFFHEELPHYTFAEAVTWLAENRVSTDSA